MKFVLTIIQFTTVKHIKPECSRINEVIKDFITSPLYSNLVDFASFEMILLCYIEI